MSHNIDHSENCQCDSCQSRVYSRSYETDTTYMEIDSIEKTYSKWYVNYTCYNKKSGEKINSFQWPIATWNKYAKINWDKKRAEK